MYKKRKLRKIIYFFLNQFLILNKTKSFIQFQNKNKILTTIKLFLLHCSKKSRVKYVGFHFLKLQIKFKKCLIGSIFPIHQTFWIKKLNNLLGCKCYKLHMTDQSQCFEKGAVGCATEGPSSTSIFQDLPSRKCAA